MLEHVALVEKGLVAKFTFERLGFLVFVTCMCAYMHLQVVFAGESFLAEITDVALDITVQDHVLP